MNPLEVVEHHIRAFNTHDIEAFLATCHPDIEARWVKTGVVRQGHTELREYFTKQFELDPVLQIEIDHQFMTGAVVVVSEKVMASSDASLIGNKVVVVNEVEDTVVRRWWTIT